MPSLVFKLYPGYPAEFDDQVFPRELKAAMLIHEKLDIAKLVLIHCDVSNSHTLVFEKEVTQAEAKVDLKKQFGDFTTELSPENFRARVTPDNPHKALLEDESISEGPFGLLIKHVVAVQIIARVSPN